MSSQNTSEIEIETIVLIFAETKDTGFEDISSIKRHIWADSRTLRIPLWKKRVLAWNTPATYLGSIEIWCTPTKKSIRHDTGLQRKLKFETLFEKTRAAAWVKCFFLGRRVNTEIWRSPKAETEN